MHFVDSLVTTGAYRRQSGVIRRRVHGNTVVRHPAAIVPHVVDAIAPEGIVAQSSVLSALDAGVPKPAASASGPERLA